MDSDILDELTNLLGSREEAIKDYPNFVAHLERENQKWLDTQYQRSREQEYPSLGEQLDMIWHEINTTGSLTDTGEWFSAINGVKQKYPKD